MLSTSNRWYGGAATLVDSIALGSAAGRCRRSRLSPPGSRARATDSALRWPRTSPTRSLWSTSARGASSSGSRPGRYPYAVHRAARPAASTFRRGVPPGLPRSTTATVGSCPGPGSKWAGIRRRWRSTRCGNRLYVTCAASDRIAVVDNPQQRAGRGTRRSRAGRALRGQHAERARGLGRRPAALRGRGRQ